MRIALMKRIAQIVFRTIVLEYTRIKQSKELRPHRFEFCSSSKN